MSTQAIHRMSVLKPRLSTSGSRRAAAIVASNGPGGGSAWQPFFLAALASSGLADLPRQVSLGSVSALALLNSVFCVLAWALWLFQPGSGLLVPAPARPFVAFVLWAILLAGFHEPTISGIQNILVVASFVGCLCLAYRLTRAG